MKTALRRLITSSLRGGLALTGERGRRLLAEALARGSEPLYEEIESVRTRRGKIDFYCLGELPRWRARTALTKEPETIEWIDGFEDGDVFWDIGANIGVYSLYAAIERQVRVLAFEPSASNYFLLNRNVELNGLDGSLQALCMAFSDRTRLDALNMQSTGFGGALSSFGVAVDTFGHAYVARFRQGMVGYSVDDFIGRFGPAFPNHIKIDVDGIEDLIVAGAAATLADPRLKSLSVELDSSRADYTRSVVDRIEAAGLALTAGRNSAMVAAGAYHDILNYQFRRVAS